MPFYSQKVMDHFSNPRNVGEIKDADGVGEVGNPVCGDMMTFYVKIKNNIVEDVKFKTFGCGAAIAVSSMVSEMGKGKSVEEAMKITNADVAAELGGLPPNKMHCSNLGADALHKALENYLSKKGVKVESNNKENKCDCNCGCGEVEICKPCGTPITECADDCSCGCKEEDIKKESTTSFCGCSCGCASDQIKSEVIK